MLNGRYKLRDFYLPLIPLRERILIRRGKGCPGSTHIALKCNTSMDNKLLHWLLLLISLAVLFSCQQSKEAEEKPAEASKHFTVHANLITEYGVAQKTVHEPPIQVVEGKIRQPAGTSVHYCTLLPANSLLHVELTFPQKTMVGSVKISADGSAPEVFKFQESGRYDIDLAHLAGKIVEISLLAEQTHPSPSAPSSAEVIEWANVVLLAQTNSPQTNAKPEKQTSDLHERFKGYDVVYLLLDAFHAEHASLYDYTRKTTPFFEELAQEAIVFENMFANVPYTLTSTATLFTSKYPDAHGLIELTDSLHPVIPTLSELLVDQGIATYIIARHGYLLGEWGLSRGFATIYQRKEGEGLEKIFEAMDEIYTQDKEKRKFIYIHIGVPHSPYLPPEQFRTFLTDIAPQEAIQPTNDILKKINSGQVQVTAAQLEHLKSWYDANVLFADHLARQLFERLQSHSVLEKTIVIVASDHGEAFLQHDRMLHGTTLFDEMIHIPFIIRFPKEIELAPRRVAQMASLVDVTPTLAAIYGIDPALTDFSGTNLLPLIFDDIPVRPFIYLQNRTGRGIRDVHYKYIRDRQQDMLFDLSADPAEQQNLVEERPITTQYYQQLVRSIELGEQTASATQRVELDHQSEEVLKSLRELGYIE